jgi:CheY-like chemotaxis protein
LGLSIVKKLIGLFEGSISLDSAENEGTTVSLLIKLGIGSGTDLSELSTPESIPDLEGVKILIVDDQPFNLEVATNLLGYTGAAITTAASGEQALELLNTESFDIVLMDIQMPGLSGTEVSRKTRNSTSLNRNVPIIALTAGTTSEGEKDISEAGMNGIVFKPVEKERLYRVISKFLVTQRIQLDSLQSLGDEAFVIRMLNLFEENIRNDLEELKIAFAEQDLNRIQALTHKMIPPCRHLGLYDLVEMLKDMESSGHIRDPADLRKLEHMIHMAIRAVARELTTISESHG